MIRRIVVASLVLFASVAVDLDTADARRGGLFRRARSPRPTSYRTNVYRTRTVRTTTSRSRYSRSPKLHETHSRSAVLDGFFGPGPGAQGHDRSWYVGR